MHGLVKGSLHISSGRPTAVSTAKSSMNASESREEERDMHVEDLKGSLGAVVVGRKMGVEKDDEVERQRVSKWF